MYYLIIILFSIQLSWAQEGLGLCDTMPELVSCQSSSSSYSAKGNRAQASRSSMKSIPSLASSAMMNPAAVSFDKGIGIEMMYQPGNALGIGLSSGTGRMGGALVSNSQENSFFGNHTYESYDVLGYRLENKKQFDTNKLSGAFGISLINSRFFEFDLGLMLKRHKELKKVNPGAGVSGRLLIFTYGFAVYNDDTLIKATPENEIEIGEEDLALKYQVRTLSVGTKVGRMTFDFGTFKTKYAGDVESKIMLYSTSYSYGRLLFNYAYKTKNFMPLGDTIMVKEKSMYAGVQLSIGKHLITGVNYNYFDLNEVSFALTIFI